MTLRPTRPDAPAVRPQQSAARVPVARTSGDEPPAHLRDIPALQRLRDADARRDRDFDRFTPAVLRRWKMYVLGALIFFPLVTWFFTPAGLQALWFQLLVSAVYGSFVAFVRPTGALAALSSVLAGLGIQAFTGHAGLGYGLLMSLVFYGLIGGAVGIGERSRAYDGR